MQQYTFCIQSELLFPSVSINNTQIKAFILTLITNTTARYSRFFNFFFLLITRNKVIYILW